MYPSVSVFRAMSSIGLTGPIEIAVFGCYTVVASESFRFHLLASSMSAITSLYDNAKDV